MTYEIPIYILLAASAFCLVRIARGPSIPDRVLATDTFLSIIISIMVLLSLETNDFLMDIAIVYAVLGFLGTIAVSKYLEVRKLGE
ncbi:MAG: monovalent cation/H+ antiporter complex subunit F [Candidatus Aenigmarchaeota archaeon]|nr:monovalent cation/H+ antiporter complex subunit F [Candidatus Aenigmarchaeota archaeon]